MGYWIVVGLVTCAALAALIAAMSDMPEWRLPRRRSPLVLRYDLSPFQPHRLDPADADWGTSLAGIAAPTTLELPGDERAQITAQQTPEDLDTLTRSRPNGIIITGIPDLVLAGEPFDRVADRLEIIVQRLAVGGGRSFILGFASPNTAAVSRGELDVRALAKLTRAWNAALSRRLSPYGARVITSPTSLAGIIDGESHKPLTIAWGTSLELREPSTGSIVGVSQ